MFNFSEVVKCCAFGHPLILYTNIHTLYYMPNFRFTSDYEYSE